MSRTASDMDSMDAMSESHAALSRNEAATVNTETDMAEDYDDNDAGDW